MNTLRGRERKERSPNMRFCKMAAVTLQKRQCEFGSLYPAGTLVNPLPRQAAGTLAAICGQRSNKQQGMREITKNYNI